MAHIKSERGFTLIEAMTALIVLTVGLLGLAAVLANSLSLVTNSSADQLARDKAYEALENIVAARETKLIPWDQLKNTAQGGRFLTGPQPITAAGADGITGTQDDAGLPVATMTYPGPDQALGTADDKVVTLTNYTRSITITNVSPAGAPDTLRQIDVVVTYTAAGRTRTYRLTTLVSSYS
jgi:Tfp pilus assembly protein PilV